MSATERAPGTASWRERLWAPDRRRDAVLAAVLALSLLANGVLMASVVVHRDNGVPTRAAGAAGSLSLGTSSVRQSIRRAATRVRLRPLHNPTKVDLERWILLSILESPTTSLPSGLIDRATGLPRNNLQVACHRASAPRTFRCVAGVLGERGDRLYIRYRGKPGGSGTFTWSRQPRRQTASSGTYFK